MLPCGRLVLIRKPNKFPGEINFQTSNGDLFPLISGKLTSGKPGNILVIDVDQDAPHRSLIGAVSHSAESLRVAWSRLIQEDSADILLFFVSNY